ncbi:hypothetical protein [Primorskyibacter sp. S187A]|uniref:hypothetical protein n=1 Tax=Primorskyibacter sp. S187A TaxID=3415130 RepID=UPI003C7AA2E6
MGAPPAQAQEELSVRAPLGQRGFADPLHWLNMVAPDRLPIRERLMVPQVGMTALAPPFPKRAGWAPWLGAGLEVNNSGGGGDQVLTLTPGVQYRYADRRLRLDASYAAELALHLERGDLEDGLSAHGGSANLSYALTPQSQLTLLNIYSQSRDTRGQRLVTGGTDTAELRSNTFALGYRHGITARTQYDVTFGHRFEALDDEDLLRTQEASLSFGYGYALSEIARLRFEGELREAHFEDADRKSVAQLAATLRHDLGPRWATEASLGLVQIGEDDGQLLPFWRAALRHSERFARYDFTAGRDVTTVPGLLDYAVSDSATARALWRVERGLMLDVSLGWQDLQVFDAIDTRVRSVTVSGQLSYALDDRYWLWGRVDLAREESGGTAETDNRLVIGLSRDLGR